MFREIKVSIEDLLLDPNNPRFSKHTDERVPEERIVLEEEQENAYKAMTDISNGFEIKSLADAIKADGFMPVDKIFVRKIDGKYLVIEGNRRVTAIKYLLKKSEAGREIDSLDTDLLDSFNEIPCSLISTEQEKMQIQKILGLRHHGSIKPWKPLPASFNLYTTYMEEYCNQNGCNADDPQLFTYDASVARKVQEMYSVKLSDVRDQVRTYRAYLQLKDIAIYANHVEIDENYSKIYDTMKDPTLRDFFGIDQNRGTFDDEKAELFINLCIGDGQQEPVIRAAASGESSLRDFKYVIQNGNDHDIDKITIERRASSVVKGEVTTRENQLNINDNLEIALKSLSKISLGEIGETGLADGEKELVERIKQKIQQLERASNE